MCIRDSAAPDQIRDETMENLKLFMEEDGWNKVEAAYTCLLYTSLFILYVS